MRIVKRRLPDRKNQAHNRSRPKREKPKRSTKKRCDSAGAKKNKAGFVSIEVDGKRFSLITSKLADENYFNQTRQRCCVGKKLLVDLTRLLKATEDRQVLVADLFASVSATKQSIRYVCGDEEAGDLFSAVLLLLRDSDDLLKFSAAKTLALKTAALLFPSDLTTPCNAIVERCRKCGMKGERVGTLIKQAREYAREFEQARRNTLGDEAAVCVRSIFSDAPVADDIVVPPGWSMSAAGVQNLLADNMPAIDCPVVITSHGTDGDTGEIWITVAWLREGKWHERTVPRAVIADNRKIIELANYGLAVTSQNVSSAVAYLADFETANLDRLSKTSVTHRLGYHEVEGQT